MENLGPGVNTPRNEQGASISSDGLSLWFNSNRERQWPDLYMSTRAAKDAPWGPAVSLGPTVNSVPAGDCAPWISPDGLELFFSSYRAGGYGRSDIYVARRATPTDPWDQAVNLGPIVNSGTEDQFPCLSPDGLLLFFGDNFHLGDPPRSGGCGGSDIWMTRRASLPDPWQPPVNLGPQVNSSVHEQFPRISPDGSTLYFITAEKMDLNTWEDWQVPIIPNCDFNADGVVDLADLVLLIENWGTDNTLYDIGPFAWGDGVVDIEDLKVFVAEWEKADPANLQGEQ